MSTPCRWAGSGGRFTRPDDSEMWDSISLNYEYPGNQIASFMCGQLPGAPMGVSNVIYGSKGQCHIDSASGGSRIFDRSGQKVSEMAGSITNAYKQEHKDLVDSIRAGTPIVELRQIADGSLVAVMGRMAAYMGQRVSWKFAADELKIDPFPKDLTWDGKLPAPGHAVPGHMKLI